MDADRLSHILYVSRAADSIDAAVVEDIVASARVFNARHQVTGLLLYSGTHFAQLIEGPEPVLASLMASIRRDTRHCDVRTVIAESHERRQFEGWTMDYVHELGVGDLLESVWAAPEVSAARARRLIEHVFAPHAPLPEP